MPTTGAPGNIWYPDATSPVAPLENLFLTLATSVNVAISAYDSAAQKIWVVTNLAALDALSTAKVGDLAWMTTPGTGIDKLWWEAHAGSGGGLDWRISDEIIAATKANLDSFISAVAAISDTRFKVGGAIYVTGTRAAYRFTSTAGAYTMANGLQPVKSSSISGSGATLNANGRIDFAACTALTVEGLNEYENYRVRFKLKGDAGTLSIELQLRASGSTDSSANYDNQTHTGFGATDNTTFSTAQTKWTLGVTGQNYHRGMFDLEALTIAQPTSLIGQLGQFSSPYSNNRSTDLLLTHRSSTVYDALVFAFSAACTGSMWVYGWNDLD